MMDANAGSTGYGAMAETSTTQTFNTENLKAIGNQLMTEGTQIGYTLLAQGKEYADSVQKAPKGLSYLSVFGGFSMIVTAILGLMWRSGTVKSFLQVYFAIFGGVILVLERQSGIFAKPDYKAFLHQYFHFLFTLYGRALFYIFCTVLLLAQFPFIPDAAVGLLMGFLSFIYCLVGFRSRKKLMSISLGSDEEAAAKFEQHDVNHDGHLDREEFQSLMDDLNMNMSQQEIDAAMLSIDKQAKGSITSEEFITFYTSK